MAPGYVFQVSLRVTVQNQIRISQRVAVNKVVPFRLLRHGHVQCILDPGAVDGDHSPIPEQQLHAAGVHVDLQTLASYFMFVSFPPYGTLTVVCRAFL